MNVIVIKGRLCKDIELKTTNSGKHVCVASVAVDRGYGEHKATDFFNCIFWEKGADFVNRYFRKGQEILIRGEMQSRSYEKDGQKRIVWEVGNCNAEFCGSKADNQTSQQQNMSNLSERLANHPMGGQDDDFAEIADDGELPF